MLKRLKCYFQILVKVLVKMIIRPLDIFPKKVNNNWKSWVKQVPVFGFNSGKYDINTVKNYFVKNLARISDVNVAKKENKNYLAPGLSYDMWCKAYGCELKKLIFPYEWLDTFEKLSHVGPCPRESFNNSLRQKSISEDRYKDFSDEFYKRKCITMGDWLREYNLADVVPFIEALDKTRKQYHPDEIDLLKDAVSIPGISMTYVLSKALDLRPPNEPELYAPGEPCTCTCTPDCSKKVCPVCKKNKTCVQFIQRMKPMSYLRLG